MISYNHFPSPPIYVREAGHIIREAGLCVAGPYEAGHTTYEAGLCVAGPYEAGHIMVITLSYMLLIPLALYSVLMVLYLYVEDYYQITLHDWV